MAAYAAAHGLAGMPLLGFGVPSAHAHVSLVALETDDPVDDIRIEFASGWTCMVQAKRTLRKGKPFDEAAEQWVAAARHGLDPARDRLTIVSSDLSRPMEALSRVLDRYKTDSPGALTSAEDAVLTHLNERLSGLTDEQRNLVLRCGSIHKVEVEEEHFSDAREGALLLTRIVRSENAARAWSALVGLAGLTARRRGGFTMSSWLAGLLGAGVEIDIDTSSVAAHLARRHAAVDRYLSMLRRRAEVLDLRGLGASLPALPLAEVDAEIRVLTDASDERSESELLWALFRRGRAVLTGLPGGGKSTALGALAAQLTDYADTSLPLIASLREVDSLDRSLGFRERLLVVALRDLAAADRELLREEIEERFRRGGLMLLLDSLDETYHRRGAVVSEVETFLGDSSPDVDVLLATRDVAYGQAATLGWADVRLAAPKEIERTISAILQAAARHRKGVNHSDWSRPRQEWVTDALRSAPTLRETPLLPVLLTLLAIERDEGSLPRERSRILVSVVHDVVARREANRRDPFALGDLHGSAAAAAALHVFALEGSAIMASGGQCEMQGVVAPIAEALAHQ